MNQVDAEDLQALIADLVRQPDEETLRLLRESLAAHMAPGRTLVAAMVNLLERMLDGTVATDRDAFELLVEASSGLNGDEEANLAIVERLDALASGVEAAEPHDDWPPSSAAAPVEPPLLTIRHDGSQVVPGGFDREPEPDMGLQNLATALEASATKLGAQVGALTLLAGPDLQRSTTELTATATDISRLVAALAEWAENNASES